MDSVRTNTDPWLLGAALLALLVPCMGHAQTAADAGITIPPDIRIDGPPPPTPPEVVTRDASGDATVRAIRLSEPIRLDGELDEAIYQQVPAVTGFIQTLPDEGAPATEQTEAWIMYDETNVYVSARIWESAPPSEWIANEMRRDTNQLRQNDHFGVVFDTFYDRRNGVMFYTNPLGARSDFSIINEGSFSIDWNPIWDVRSGRFDGGWTVEMEIPFKSLRYRPGKAQVWGIQLRRAIRRKNEWVHLTLIPRSAVSGTSGSTAIFRVSANGTLVGLEAPEASRNVEIKPYVISGLTTDRAAEPPTSNDPHGDIGLDVKYGITENLTADFTYNTDFAQVEVDEQQVNLTRFNLFFPEKREFFLEGSGIFDFAIGGIGGGGRGGNTPTLFFSRRIGLESGEPVPILLGGRVTGKVGEFDVGALNLQTEAAEEVGVESTNFTVLRLRRDILRRSSIGALFAGRSRSVRTEGSNQTYGVDGSFSFLEDLNLVTSYARTRTRGLTDHDESYQSRVSYNGDVWGAQLARLLVGENFNPEVGFVRQVGFRESQLSGRFSPRPRSIDWIRQFTLEASLDYLEDADDGFVETRTREARFQIEFESSDVFSVALTDSYEFLERPFEVASRATIPAGQYAFRDVRLGYNFGLHRPYSGNVSVESGSFYDGDKTTVSLSQGRINASERLSIEPSFSLNWIDLPGERFRTDLAVTRVNYAFTPRLFLGGLIQYNSSSETFGTNFRLRWEFKPGSEIFLVYTEARDTDVLDRFSTLSNRGFVIKANYLFRP